MTRSHYPASFRAEALRRLGTPGQTVPGLAEELGVHATLLYRWRRQADVKRIRELERELTRKDKALAEAAALLVLQKKTRSLLGGGDDDIQPSSGR